ncbi:MAG: hypothetical protein KIH62_003360 [Candidatus Kerfeldbacteria bacterium]|nr:hypothetical protein [Candidatus Kerfeldbacteria bacterium]
MNERVFRHIKERQPVGEEKRLLDRAARLEVVRTCLLSSIEAAYYLGWRDVVNPEGKPKTVLYSHMGPDIVTPLLATDATEIIGVDPTVWNDDEIEGVNNLSWRDHQMPQSFIELRRNKGFYAAPDNRQRALMVCNELVRLGAAPEDVCAARMNEDGVEIVFSYGGKKRRIVYYEESWDFFQKDRDIPFDIFYQKASMGSNALDDPNGDTGRHYILSHLRSEGYVMQSSGRVPMLYDNVVERHAWARSFVRTAGASGLEAVRAPLACNRLIQRMRARDGFDASVWSSVLYGTYLKVAQKKSA